MDQSNKKRMNSDSTSFFTLITGASQGIGKALAMECAKRKMNLFLVALPGSGLKELADELRSAYQVSVEFQESDLTHLDCHKEVYEYAKAKNLSINMLINNAGIGLNGIFENLTPEEIDQMILLNLRATTLLTNVFIHDLILAPKSYILNMCSMASFAPLPGKSIYAATKAFLMFFSKALRYELKRSGISVTSVYPYGVMTNDLVKERIKRSGFFARKAIMTAEEVAKISIEGMLKGKNIIIPGKIGKSLFYSGLLLPQGLVLSMMEHEIGKAPH